jgi:L-lactate dehydrogenase complex protein LldG
MTDAREEILGKVRSALGRSAGSAAPALPASARVAPRTPGDSEAELELLLEEIRKLGGTVRRLTSLEELATALAELVKAEGVRKAALWSTPQLRQLGIEQMLVVLGVSIVSGSADKRQLAECELGVTGADALLPETGTLLLRSGPERPRAVSLVPRVHLAIVHPSALRADLHQALADVKGEGYAVLVSGPSRTADIELTLTVGVHGPKSLYVLVLP